MSKHSSLFSQIIQNLSRKTFQELVRKHQSDRNCKGFTSWDHFISMLFCQFSKATSLREIENGMRSCEGKLNHLGMNIAPTRSNLSYVNQHRTSELFHEMFLAVLDQCTKEAKTIQRKFDFKHRLFSLDASVIQLCLSSYDWAHYRRKKGAIKLHLLLDHATCAGAWEERFFETPRLSAMFCPRHRR